LLAGAEINRQSRRQVIAASSKSAANRRGIILDAPRIRLRKQPRRQRAAISDGRNFAFQEYGLIRRAKQWQYAVLALYGRHEPSTVATISLPWKIGRWRASLCPPSGSCSSATMNGAAHSCEAPSVARPQLDQNFTVTPP
jgi:hypothetical protein